MEVSNIMLWYFLIFQRENNFIRLVYSTTQLKWMCIVIQTRLRFFLEKNCKIQLQLRV